MPSRGLYVGGFSVATISVATLVLLLFCLPGLSSGLTPAELGAQASAPGTSGTSSGTSAISDDDSTLDFYKRLYDFGLGKRAYSYVSEYKRLPVYNFGLGKRADRTYSFGLGKRDRSLGRTYSFGIGKRDYEDDEEFGDDDDQEVNDGGSWEGGEVEWSPEEAKRARQMYSFGLGKRARQMYGFGIGKRARTYSFGIGKRYPRYGFGLGKRGDEDEYAEDETVGDDGMEAAKRKDHRFSFGLGKREVSEYGPDEEKRGGHYDFGIGKRASDGGRGRQAGQGASFGRAGRRTYSFGLGKRLPMYDFGLGKRAEATVVTEANGAADGGSNGKH